MATTTVTGIDKPVSLVRDATSYIEGATALIAGSGNVANASAAATLTGTATTTVYITGFEITGAGATGALVVTPTIAGLLGGTRSYTYTFPAGAAVACQPLVVQFYPPLPASAVNTAIRCDLPCRWRGQHQQHSRCSWVLCMTAEQIMKANPGCTLIELFDPPLAGALAAE